MEHLCDGVGDVEREKTRNGIGDDIKDETKNTVICSQLLNELKPGRSSLIHFEVAYSSISSVSLLH